MPVVLEGEQRRGRKPSSVLAVLTIAPLLAAAGVFGWLDSGHPIRIGGDVIAGRLMTRDEVAFYPVGLTVELAPLPYEIRPAVSAEMRSFNFGRAGFRIASFSNVRGRSALSDEEIEGIFKQ
jgi:hypothetical protein